MSAELWSALVGTLVGAAISGIASFGTAIYTARSVLRSKGMEFEHAWKQQQDNDLRVFQEAATDALDTVEYEVGLVGTEGLDKAVANNWMPIKSHREIQRAAMLAVRVDSGDVQEAWSTTHSHLRDAIANLQTALSTRDPENPLMALLQDEARDIVHRDAPQFVTEALKYVVQARRSYDSLTSTIDQAMKVLRSKDWQGK